MAADWIKMRCELQSHPKIVRILSALDTDKFRVIGGLHAVWSVFDAHSEDGVLHGYTAAAMDHVIGWNGFSSAMIAVGWLSESEQTLVMPGFSEHNGQSAKRRAEDQKRKRDGRKTSDENADEMRTEIGPEKRREEKKKKKNPPTPRGVEDEGFAEFYSAYPRKEARQGAAKAWDKLSPSADLRGRMLAAVKAAAASEQWRKDGGKFVPLPATWLNGRRWEDQSTGEVPEVRTLFARGI